MSSTKAFHAHPADTFSPDEWKKYESYWMVVDGKIAGCVAMETGKKDELWISSTAVLPEFRGQKFGDKLKQWEIDYAKSHGYERIGTIMRENNKAITHLNEKFGFKKEKVVPGAYSDPAEPGIVMRLRLPLPNCPKCAKQLRTHRAKQCACGADWH